MALDGQAQALHPHGREGGLWGNARPRGTTLLPGGSSWEDQLVAVPMGLVGLFPEDRWV